MERQRPIFPTGLPVSIFGAEGLNFRVRYENGWFPLAIATVMAQVNFKC